MSQPSSQSAPPTRRRTTRIVVGTLALAVLLVAGLGLTYLFMRPEGPAAVADATLPPAPTVTASTEARASASATATPVPVSAAPATATASGIDGTWSVDPSIGSFADFSGTFVGYRVREELAGIGAKTAVGRTPDVTGSMTFAGTTVTAATIEADLTTLESDDGNRDRQLGRQGIQTGLFPTATFTITAPIELGAVPTEGEQIEVTATGQLTLHGQTQEVEVPMKARLDGDVIVVSGSIPIRFADYGIEKPESFKVLSVEDHGIMEFQVFFSR